MNEQAQFYKQIRDALTHLYDSAYLECHTLVPKLLDPSEFTQLSRAQLLRSLLKETIEALRPRQGSPSSAPEWRSYLALRYRYVQEMSLLEIQEELGISRRQLQREQRKGLKALTALLWERRVTPSPELAIASDELEDLEALRQELNQWEMNRQSCPVSNLINDTHLMLKPWLTQRKVALQIDLLPPLPPVFVDPILTRQALLKVLRLIIQATGGGQVSVQVTAHPHTVDLILQSEQTDESQSTVNESSPITSHLQKDDWQIANLLVKRQGGLLTIDTTPQADLIVKVSLPLASRVRVLVIDDNEAIHRLFERYLVPHNYEVVSAQNGDEAVRLAVELQPDLITLDVMMPSMDGWQVLRDLQHNDTTKQIPKVVCSVFNEPELALSLGANAFIKKPVSRMELLSALEQVGGKSVP